MSQRKNSFNHKGHEVHKGKIKDKLRVFDFYHDLYIANRHLAR